MDRRTFVFRLAALCGSALALGTQPARALAARGIELQHSPVAGFQYHEGAVIWPSLHIGDSLQLIREPDNAYDRQAVRVDWNGRKLGYVPRIQNITVSHLLDQGHPLSAEIIRLESGTNPWSRVTFAVYLPKEIKWTS